VRGEGATEMAAIEEYAGDPEVRRVDPISSPDWDVDLSGCPAASFFHGSSWARVLKDTYGFEPYYLVVRPPDGTLSFLPLMEIDSPLTGKRGVSLPFTDECSPICADSGTFKALHAAAMTLGKQRGWKYIECRGGLPLYGDATPSVSFYRHRLDLSQGESALWDKCDSSVRRAIRKAEQAGLTVEFSREKAALRDFYGLFCKTRRRHGVPPQPMAFFSNIHRQVLSKNQGLVLTVKINDKPIASAIYFHYRRTVIYKFGASDVSFQHLRPNNLVMWEAIKRHTAEGFQNLDFGRTSLTNEGLRNFKQSWGTAEDRIDYIRQDCRTGRYLETKDAASGLHTRFMAVLPDPLFRLVGSLLYKHVA
jgi:hypothetical protein